MRRDKEGNDNLGQKRLKDWILNNHKVNIAWADEKKFIIIIHNVIKILRTSLLGSGISCILSRCLFQLQGQPATWLWLMLTNMDFFHISLTICFKYCSYHSTLKHAISLQGPPTSNSFSFTWVNTKYNFFSTHVKKCCQNLIPGW